MWTTSGLPGCPTPPMKARSEWSRSRPFDLDDALSAAADGFKMWSRTSPAKRGDIMRERGADARTRRRDRAPRSRSNMASRLRRRSSKWCAAPNSSNGMRPKVSAPMAMSSPASRASNITVLQRPIGMVAAFSPWNFPMSSAVRVRSPALWLPAVRSSSRRRKKRRPVRCISARALQDAGLPPGVLNLVFGVPAEMSELSYSADRRCGWSPFTGSIGGGQTADGPGGTS